MKQDEGRGTARRNVEDELARRRWNVSDLADNAGIDVGTAGDFLNGTRWPQRATQAKIEAAFAWPAGTIRRWELGLDAEAPEPADDVPQHDPSDVLVLLAPGALDGLPLAAREEIRAVGEAAMLARARQIRREMES